MDRMLYVAMSGAKETLHAQAAVNNNMANANTPGFLADLQQFRSMPVFGAGYPTRVFAMSERPASDRSPGTLDHRARSRRRHQGRRLAGRAGSGRAGGLYPARRPGGRPERASRQPARGCP